MSPTPAGPTSEPTPYIRARAGGDVDARRVGRALVAIAVLVLAGVVVATTIGAAHQNSAQTKLQRHGVPIDVTVVTCISYGSGIGQGVTYWACRGDYTLDGHTYRNEPIGGNRAFQPAGRILHAFTVPGDPSLVSTAIVSKKFSRWTPYITPIILAAVTIALAVGLVLWPRRRRRAAVALTPSGLDQPEAGLADPGAVLEDPAGGRPDGAAAIGAVDAGAGRPDGDDPVPSRLAFLKLTTIVVDDYDPAINFFVHGLGFDLTEDTASVTNAGSPKRWVVVRPPGAQTGFLLARAEGEEQSAIVGKQTAGRVGFFLQVEDFEAAYQRLQDAGAEFVAAPRTEPYGRVVVFCDIAGNRWDLLGPAL